MANPRLADYGYLVKSFDDSNAADGTAGLSFALPQKAVNHIQWSIDCDSAPSVISIGIQVSNDNSTWTSAATSTNTAGEVGNITSAGKFVRAFLTTLTGGSNLTVSFNVLPSSTAIGGSSSSGTVVGPVSSTNKAVARWNGTAGDTLQDSLITISDAGGVTIPTLAASGNLLNLVFSDVNGLLSPLTTVQYDPAYIGPGSDENAHATIVSTKALVINPTFTQSGVALSSEGFYSNVTYTPGAPATAGNMRGIFASVHAIGSNAFNIITGIDTYVQADSGQSYLTIIGQTTVATVAGASSSTLGGIIGITASAVQQHAGATTPTIIALQADPTNGGSRALLGTVTGAFYGLKVTGMSTTSAAAIGTRAGIYVGPMAGSVSGTDFGLFIEATQANKLIGPLSLGKGSSNTATIALNNATNNNILNITTGITTTTYTITLPIAVATITGSFLSSDNSGVCSWAATGVGILADLARGFTTTTQSATPTINTDVTSVSHITGLAQAITSFTTNLSGTPVEGQSFRINITDNGTARALTFGTSFESSGTVTLPTTTVLGVRLEIGFVWNSVTSKWRCVATA